MIKALIQLQVVTVNLLSLGTTKLRPNNRDFIFILFYFPTEILPDSDQSSQGTDEIMDFEIAAQSKCEGELRPGSPYILRGNGK